MSNSPKELYEELKDRYDAIYERFEKFHNSPLALEHKETLADFIHDTAGLAQRVGRALLKGELPEGKRPSPLWHNYNALLTATGIMELILALASDCGPDAEV